MAITLKQAKDFRKIIEKYNSGISDDDVVAAPFVLKAWDGNGVDYAVGDRVQHGGEPYKCLQAHTSQDAWNPKDAASLWAKILIPDPAVIPDWVQPDSTNPYMKGDKVRHVEKVWESLIDNNVWEPGTPATESLWAEVTG